MHAKWRQIENAGDRRRRYCAQILCSILRRIVSYSPGFIEAPLFASLAYYHKRAPLTEWAHDAQRARRGLHIIKYSLRNNCVRQAWGRACSTSCRCHYSCRSLRMHTIVLMFSQLAYCLAVISVPAAVFMTPCTKRIPSYLPQLICFMLWYVARSERRRRSGPRYGVGLSRPDITRPTVITREPQRRGGRCKCQGEAIAKMIF